MISCGADGEVRHMRLLPASSDTPRPDLSAAQAGEHVDIDWFGCHRGMVHELATLKHTPEVRAISVCVLVWPSALTTTTRFQRGGSSQVFFSGSDDGTVRFFDLRARHTGPCHDPAPSHPCHNVVVDLREAGRNGRRVGVDSIAINPANESACAVCGVNVGWCVCGRCVCVCVCVCAVLLF